MPLDRKRRRSRKTKGISTVNRIKKGIDVVKVLEHYKVENMKSTEGKFINCSCPLPSHGGPDSSPSFGMFNEKGSDRNGSFNCFKCGKGDIIDFIKKMEGVDFNAAKNFLVNLGGIEDPYSIGLLDKEVDEIKEGESETEAEDLKRTFIPIIMKDTAFVAKYLVENESRNFEFKRALRVIEKFRIGISIYRGSIKIIVPIFDHHGNLITIFAQNPEENSEKYYPKGAPTGSLLFGLNVFKNKTKKIILTEGVWDALRLISYGLPAVASFSTSFTLQQANLMTAYFDEVYVAYDNDDGGKIGLERIGKYLYPILTIKAMNFPDGKDPCDCTKNEIKKALKSAIVVQFFDDELL